MKTKILYLISLAYFISGYHVFTTSDVSLALIRHADPSIVAHTDMFTLKQIGAIFMMATVAAVLMTLDKRSEWAYGLLTFLMAWWSLLYVVSWIQTGYWQSVYGFVNYGLVAAILVMCSKIAEMPKGMRESFSTPLPFEILKKGRDSGS